MLPQELIRLKRDGFALDDASVQAFVRGLVDGSFSDAQVGAMAMAVLLRGMDTAETVALTAAMTHSGEVLDWSQAGLPGPVLDKHSTGGVGDKVSLLLAPLVAACGGVVPMISGRGLGHTGGTLDKLEALPGYQVNPDPARLLATLRSAGCAIVGASPSLAPADRRLYAVRDVTATVESLPLITASILSKKLAAGLQALVMDVKVGNGAFCTTLAEARALARSLVDVAGGAGLPTVALLTDMDQVLGTHAGNALEVAEVLAALRAPARCAPRLRAVTTALAGRLLHQGGLAASPAEGEARITQAWHSGAAMEGFARMVAGLGGPADVAQDAGLPQAPERLPVPAPRSGWVGAMDTRALGLAIVALGGGRRQGGDAVDPRVGLAEVVAIGQPVAAGEPLAWVHAATPAAARQAVQAVAGAFKLADAVPIVPPVVLEIVE
ncbi:MAG: thymidine phosphorylase [Rubrivivax sp.]|nr:thymidine phosphorylase [Rubrivivax sp.]